MSSLTAAEVSIWIAHLAVVEARALDCREPAQAARADELLELSRELHDRARELDSSDTLWERAIAKWTAEVKPAAHCATPMSGSEIRSVHQLRNALKRKPSRRRGTKPASLPQLLSAAANSLKEP